MDFNNEITWKDTNSSPSQKKPRPININTNTKILDIANKFTKRRLSKINSLQEIINKIDVNYNTKNKKITNDESEDKKDDNAYINNKIVFNVEKENNKTTQIVGLANLPNENISTYNNVAKEKLSSNFDDFMFEEYDISTFIVQEISKQKDSIVLSSEKIRLIVKDEWTNIKYHKGMKISFFCCVCNACNANKNVNTYIVDRNNNMLMIEDELISVTSFCTVFKCDYKPVLSSYVLDLSFTYNHSSLVIGIIIHTVIEKCISSGFVLKSIVKNIKDEINNNIKLMYTCNVDEKYVIVECMKYVKHILSIKEYLDKIQCDYKSDKNVVEKKITSQKYGLRGIIDALLVGKNGTIITEIKTGKKIDIAHRAQVLMYYLMMKDKVCKLSDKMLLFYAFEGKYVNIIPKHEELMHMIIKRNIITSLKYISKNNIKDTENILGNEFIADCRCNDNEYCKKISLMHQIIHEYEDNHIDVIKTKIDCEDTTKIRSVNQQGAEINNIKQRHIVTEQEYKMAKWMKEQWDGINEEEEYEKKEQKINTCFFDQNGTEVILSVEDKNKDKLNNLKEFVDLHSTNGYKLTYARVLSIQENRLYLNIREDILLSCYYNIHVSNTKGGLIYKTMRYTLLNITQNNNVMQRILEGSQPKIKSQQNTYMQNLSSSNIKYSNNNSQKMTDDVYEYNIPSIFKEEFMQLNDDQRSALYLSLNCKEYRLIHGYPGTGKSTLIALLIKILVHYKKKVLLITYTNLALENLLKKLNLKTYRAAKENKEYESVKQMKDYLNNIDLVAGTCYSFKDEIFIERRFDFCVIDEASQQHLLLSLLPISLCDKFILVGDHLQLKPLTRKSAILKISLFEKLYVEASELKKQYRMGDNIMKISNAMFYNNKMQGFGGDSILQIIDSQKSDIKTIITDQFIIKNDKCSETITNNISNKQNKESKNHKSVILCYFNTSVSYIKKHFKDNVVVETVDRFQGSEADTVLLYLDPVVENEIMVSRERMNVALTRAKKKLIIFGDTTKLIKIKIFKELFEQCKNFSNIYYQSLSK